MSLNHSYLCFRLEGIILESVKPEIKIMKSSGKIEIKLRKCFDKDGM